MDGEIMASISELNEVVSGALNEDYSTVAQYSRRLIDAGFLPKSKGRAIADARVGDVIKLLVAVGARPKLADTARFVEEYLSLTGDGVPETAPEKLRETTFERMLYTLLMVIAPHGKLKPEFENHRKRERKLTYEINLTWPEILVYENGHIVEAFKNEGLPGHWNGDHKRTFSFSANLFDKFDDFNFQIEEHFWETFPDEPDLSLIK
ncbi:MAG: hypothetical protein HRU33_15400 [Rhodobacteraceae bacterium]|nr:hypothetical protein [Paracoccaceae bacterium]